MKYFFPPISFKQALKENEKGNYIGCCIGNIITIYDPQFARDVDFHSIRHGQWFVIPDKYIKRG